MMKGTLLTGEPLTPEEEAAQQKKQALEVEAFEVAEIIVKMWFDCFHAGEVTFETYCRNVFECLRVKNIQPFSRQKKMGAAIEAAIKNPPSATTRNRKSKRARPERLQVIFHDLVELAHKREGFPKTMTTSKPELKTAFEKASEVLCQRGISASPASVFHGWVSHRKSKNIRKSK